MRSPSNNKRTFLLLWLTCHASAPNMAKASMYRTYTRYQIRKLTTVTIHTYQNHPAVRTKHDLGLSEALSKYDIPVWGNQDIDEIHQATDWISHRLRVISRFSTITYYGYLLRVTVSNTLLAEDREMTMFERIRLFKQVIRNPNKRRERNRSR
jgi:hypothetical protein